MKLHMAFMCFLVHLPEIFMTNSNQQNQNQAQNKNQTQDQNLDKNAIDKNSPAHKQPADQQAQQAQQSTGGRPNQQQGGRDHNEVTPNQQGSEKQQGSHASNASQKQM